MMRLAGSFTRTANEASLNRRTVMRLSSGVTEARAAPDKIAYLLPRGSDAPDGCISVTISGRYCNPATSSPLFELPSDCDYVRAGDIIRLEAPTGRFRVLFRQESAHNNFLVTEQCDNFCLMCSQPPKRVDDSWVLDDLFAAIPLIARSTRTIGFTGGEPTLLGNRFIDLIKLCKIHLSATAVHVLSNGRRFSDPSFAERWASIGHNDLMVGIPIYSDQADVHDYVVQARGAFDETVKGILNLKRLGQRVEVRVVLHKQTVSRLPQLAKFLARNLLFVDHVALMGLEITGFTRANLEQLWIDPVAYQQQLYEAIMILDDFGVPTSIYNLQLCLLDRRLWQFAVKSISDWKREYFRECDGCEVQAACGGMFSSAIHRRSEHIKAIRTLA